MLDRYWFRWIYHTNGRKEAHARAKPHRLRIETNKPDQMRIVEAIVTQLFLFKNWTPMQSWAFPELQFEQIIIDGKKKNGIKQPAPSAIAKCVMKFYVDFSEMASHWCIVARFDFISIGMFMTRSSMWMDFESAKFTLWSMIEVTVFLCECQRLSLWISSVSFHSLFLFHFGKTRSFTTTD